MPYKSTKSIVRSSDGDTDFFDVIIGVLQENTFASYFYTLFRLRTSKIHRSDKRKWFHIEKAKK